MLQRGWCIFKLVWDIFFELYFVAFEVDRCNIQLVFQHIDSHEISGCRIEAIDVRFASSVGFLLSEVQDIAVVLKLDDQFGDGRNTQVHFTAQIGNGRIAIGNIVMDDLLFQKFIAVVIIGRQ